MPNLRERVRSSRVWGVLAVYVGISWVILQIVDIVKQNLGLPGWVFPVSLLLLLIGLPIIVATAFLQAGPTGPVVHGAAGGMAADGGARPAPGSPAPGSPAPGGPVPGSQEPADAAPADPRAGEGDRAPVASGRRLFTWRNALLGGGLAFLLLAAGTGAFMYMRSAGIGPVGSLVAKGILEERGRIVLAEFRSADSVLSRTVTESFRVDLSQSPVVELVEPDSIANGLARMGRPAGTPLDEATARELAVRDGIPAVLAGEVASLGAGYVLTARLVASTDGAVLASARASAREPAALLDAIDQVSSKLREQIGESYTSLRATPSLEHVTTGSLEALKKYTQAQDARFRDGNPEAAVRLLEEAVAIDSTFALAWRDLATILGNARASWTARIDATERAYRYRDRLTERERYLVEAAYYQEVADEPPRTIASYEAMLRLDPADAQALNNIGYTYYKQADWENALHWYGRAHAAAPDVALHLANVASTQANLENFGTADSLYAELVATSPDPVWDSWRGAYLWQKGDEEEARETFQRILRERPNRPAARARASVELANLDLVHGRLRRAIEGITAVADARRAAGDGGQALEILVRSATWRLTVAADTAGALESLEAALVAVDPETVPPLDRPWDEIAGVLLDAGEVERGRAVLERSWSEIPDLLKPAQEKYRAEDRARIASAEGRPLEALAEVRTLPPGQCVPCRAWIEAKLLDEAGRPDSAIVLYERYLETPWNFRLYWDAESLAPTHERLGQLYDDAGDAERAALHYARFVELWEDADPGLQPRVEEARARLQRIMRERG